MQPRARRVSPRGAELWRHQDGACHSLRTSPGSTGCGGETRNTWAACVAEWGGGSNRVGGGSSKVGGGSSRVGGGSSRNGGGSSRVGRGCSRVGGGSSRVGGGSNRVGGDGGRVSGGRGRTTPGVHGQGGQAYKRGQGEQAGKQCLLRPMRRRARRRREGDGARRGQSVAAVELDIEPAAETRELGLWRYGVAAWMRVVAAGSRQRTGSQPTTHGVTAGNTRGDSRQHTG